MFRQPGLAFLFFLFTIFTTHSSSSASSFGLLDPNERADSDYDEFRQLTRALMRRQKENARELVAIENVHNFVENIMKCRRVPGLTLTVVRGDQVLIQRGYGVTNLHNDAELNDESQMCIGSGTKPFVAVLLGILLEEQKHRFPRKWNTKIKEVMHGDFHFADDLRTEETTIRDLLAHRVGFLEYEGAWMVGLDGSHSRQEYCGRLWKLKPIADFRTTYSYSNFMYMLGACVAENLGGSSFEHLMRKRVLEPLKMHGSFFISEAADADLPRSYHLNETSGIMQELDPLLLRAVSPADSSGGLCTTAKDMTHWLQLQLREGKLREDTELLSHSFWDEMHTSQMFLKPSSMPIAKPFFPVTDEHTAHGLGWTLGTYRGYKYVRHGGTVSGFGSLTTVFKDMDLAIFSSINGPMTGGTANDVIHYHIADSIFNLEPWLNDINSCSFPSPWSFALPSARPSASQRFANRKRPSRNDRHHRLQAKRKDQQRQQLGKLAVIRNNQKYTGNYGHLLFGNMTVFYDEGSLELKVRFGQIGIGRLLFQSEEIWSIAFEGPLFFLADSKSSKFTFLLFFEDNQEGKFLQIRASFYEKKTPPVFHRDLKWTDPKPTDKTTRGFFWP